MPSMKTRREAAAEQEEEAIQQTHSYPAPRPRHPPFFATSRLLGRRRCDHRPHYREDVVSECIQQETNSCVMKLKGFHANEPDGKLWRSNNGERDQASEKSVFCNNL